jgi:hypothetical protein
MGSRRSGKLRADLFDFPLRIILAVETKIVRNQKLSRAHCASVALQSRGEFIRRIRVAAQNLIGQA